MATPNMDTITASLERSLQNCSLNHQQSSSGGGGGGGPPRGSDSLGDPSSDAASALATAALELNSQTSLPTHWEQCLDLKTGEIYFINWRTGMKSTEDPRSTAEYGGGYYSEDDCSSYDSDGSSSESSPSRGKWSGKNNDKQDFYCQENLEKEKKNNSSSNINSNNVLVVAGCKSCLMYYMVPKQLEICPKCCGQLLHFDRSENGSP
ncbi:protein CURLY FLAG LEAF 1 [Primulina tabacum]|uniref:protein CURLY FLAG LEAF 1 n=1 Tax=Primulina tabacum TaxID=48773 RepID=UPI003F590CC1